MNRFFKTLLAPKLVRRREARPRRLAITTLESRLAPAATLTASFDYADGVLRIEGTDGPDVIRIVNTAGQVSVTGISIRSTNSGPVWTNVATVPAAAIGYVDVRALAGNDQVETVEQGVTPAAAVRMVMYGQQGHDTLTGGSAADGLYGGTGSDVLTGNGGADHLEGGFSSDSVNVQAAQLDRDLGLYASEKYDWENSNGRGEKWIYGTSPDWAYYILPNGELYRWDGTMQSAGTNVPALVDEAVVFYASTGNYAASGTLIATLDPSYHQNLIKLVNANVLSGAPLAQDPLGPRAADLDRQLGLAVQGQENLYGGHQERWLMDGRLSYAELAERSDAFYYILPNGQLYRWDGNPDVLGGTLVATLDASYYQDLTKLADAQHLFGNPAGSALAAWYAGEGNTTDATGGNDGTAVGTVGFASGQIGQAFQFSGFQSPGYVRVPNAPELESTTVTVEAWVNSTSINDFGAYSYILSKGAADFRGASYALVTSISGGLWFYVGNGSAFAYSPDPGTSVWDGNWHHVVGTYDGSYVRLYVDGTEIGEGNRLDNILGYGLPDTNDLFIGTYNAIPGYTFNGRIDEPSVYGRALNAAEVRDLFAGGKGALPTGDAGDNDNISGGAGNDTALGGDGSDTLNGGLQDDFLVGGNDNDSLRGEQGNDQLIGCHFGNGTESGNPNDTLMGNAGDDSLYGGDGADRMEGDNGNDYLKGDGGNDEMYGGYTDATSETGAANDTLEGGNGSDVMSGGVGADWLIGQNDNDYADGGRGADTLIGCWLGFAGEAGNPNDTLYGGDGNDSLFGGDGADRMVGQSNDDFLWGDGGNDVMYGDQSSIFVASVDGADTIHGGDGDDVLDGSDGRDRLFGENGNDSLNGGYGADLLIGCFDGWAGETGGANDTIVGSNGSDSLYGGDGADSLVGENGSDWLYGDGGDDRLDGGLIGFTAETGGTSDVLYGGEGNDLLWGGEGSDTLTGDSGADTLMGESGADDLDGGLRGFDPEVGFANDLLDGGAADDFMWGGEGMDTMTGGLGQDTLNGESGNDWMDGGLPGTASEGTFGSFDVLDGGTGDDFLWGGEGSDTLVGGFGSDTLNGESGSDWLDGGFPGPASEGAGGADVLDGGSQGDTLWGGEGPDTLRGLAGNDRMFGEDGDDVLYGGAGRDNLDGGWGEDGLFGGANDGNDTLVGGGDGDRFLMPADTNDSGATFADEDSELDFAPEDARPIFLDGWAMTSSLGNSYTAKDWTDQDIERTDAVLALLQRQATDTRLLDVGEGDLVFVRHGTTNRGFNDGKIHMTDAGLQYGDTDPNDKSLRGYILHEIGHYWQGGAFQSAGTDYWNQFVAVSDWRTMNPNDPAFSLTLNDGQGNQWYRTNTEFASLYARNSMNDDFAESFTAFFTQRAGWAFYLNNGPGTPPPASGAAAIPLKIAIFANWLPGL